MVPFALLDGGIDLRQVVMHASPVAKAVILILLVFSIGSWVVILRKWALYLRGRQVSANFRALFKRSSNWQDIKVQADRYAVSPLTGLFLAGYNELTYQLKVGQEGRMQMRRMEALERSIQRASVVEMGRLERSLGLLATVAAVSPFVGLFGTVWGIIDAFQSIGSVGNASLATVAPGIADALIATALGLVAAIPALMAYNFFQGQMKQWQAELDDYALEFLTLSERNFT
ncbi:MAG TPA: MotA/TolQ/ExbB proton channel family protein [Holophagaceae bacterium]|jgi:biopolymer transport protein TolQ|nr:MotA/TolQ/ExbB proton channel family protein [Holophagaceae bacterium]